MGFNTSLYRRVHAITEDYLGPAAPRFLSRIATNHLGKPLTQLNEKDLPELITWIQLAANMMTDNTTATQEYVERLRALHTARAEARVSSGQRLHKTSY